MQDAEVRLVLELPGSLELGVRSLLGAQLLDEGLVRGLGEPALLIEQSQHPRGVRLGKGKKEIEQSEVDEAPLNVLSLLLLLLPLSHPPPLLSLTHSPVSL